MKTFRHMIRRVRRRTLINQAIHHAGHGILAGLGLGIAMLIADRLGAFSLASPLLFIIPVVIGLIAGILFAVSRIPDPMAAAVHIDRALHLQDQFGSAEALQSRDSIHQSPYDKGFTSLVIDQADHLASRIDVRTASPIRMTGVWGGSLVVAGALWLGILFLPALSAEAESLSPEETAAEAEQAQQERTELATNIENTIEELKDEDSLDERSRTELESLQRLADQLTADNASDLDVNRIRDESAARLNDLADQIAEKAERDLAASEQVARRFAGMKTPETPVSAEEFTEALKRGDLDRAADLLDEMQNQAGQMSDQEREMIAQHLRRLSDNLQDAEAFDERLTEERGQQIEQALRDQGLDEPAIRDLIENPPEKDDLQRELEKNNIDEEIAQKLARDIERLEEKRSFDEQTREDTDAISEALDRAAEQIENPPSESEPEPEQNENQPSGDETPAPSEQPDNSSDQPNLDEQPEGEQDQTQPTETLQQSDQQAPDTQRQQSGEEQAEGSQQQQQRQAGEEATGAQQQQTGKEQPGEPPTGEKTPGEIPDEQLPKEQPTGERPTGEQPPDDVSPRQPPGPESPPPAQPEKKPGEGAQPQEAPIPDPENPEENLFDPDAPEQSEDQQSPDATGEEQSSPDRQMPEIDEEMMKRAQEIIKRMPADMLRDLAEQARKAAKNQEISEELKQQARDMLEQLSEEQKRALGELFRPPSESDQSPDGDADGLDANRRGQAETSQQATGQGYQFEDTEDLDLRGMEKADQVIAEWLSDKPREGDPGRTSKSNRARRIRSAQKVAERAVNESVVPTRYHEFIKRYFDRLDRTVQKATGESPTPPTPPVKSDAKTKTSSDSPADKDN
ncbi:MAG: hypothetical protein IIB54_02260 [Planctomycetes bacterium]|nr:hypothetical protein [Planctomycetota bacterium]